VCCRGWRDGARRVLGWWLREGRRECGFHFGCVELWKNAHQKLERRVEGFGQCFVVLLLFL